uniref:Endoplasmic reticulum lectin 1 n=1 Tax=Angiostrongylus cantonensis TaxID=6313 RepID=A0A158P702_ANGCA
MNFIPLLLSILVKSVFATKVDDSVHYFVTFDRIENELAGIQLLEENEKLLKDSSLRISTPRNENYICRFPEVYRILCLLYSSVVFQSSRDASSYTGPSPDELIASIYKDKLCSYRVDPYWTYELCHGRYIVQYHEEKELRGVGRTSEYYLGNLHVDYATKGSPDNHDIPPKKIIDGEERAYFPVLYNQGTTCDITGKPRTTIVKYNAHIQIHSLSEVSSCNYEVIVLTNRICTHPAYKPKEKRNQEIVCYNTHGGEIVKPLSLVQLEDYHRDTFKRVCFQVMQNAIDIVVLLKEEFSITTTDEVTEFSMEGGKTTDEFQPQSERQKVFKLSGQKSRNSSFLKFVLDVFVSHSTMNCLYYTICSRYKSVDTLANNRLIVEDTVNRIISGSECIYGGEGWWKYEFCYGKNVSKDFLQLCRYPLLQNPLMFHLINRTTTILILKFRIVLQYHQEPNGDRTEILLGVFDEAVHKAWIDEDKTHRSPKKVRAHTEFFSSSIKFGPITISFSLKSRLQSNNQVVQISHLYSKGDICHELNAHRNVEVNLRCKTAGSPLAISLSLTEPKLCQYILVIESERFCEPLQYADEYGRIAVEPVHENGLPGVGPL